MKTNLAFLLLINIGFASCRLLEKDVSDVLRKSHEEETSQDDKVQQLAEAQDKKSLESFDAKSTGGKKRPMKHSLFGDLLSHRHTTFSHLFSYKPILRNLCRFKTGVLQLSRWSCRKLFKGGQCRLYEVASRCESTCCRNELSWRSCRTVAHSGICSSRFFQFGACRKSCHGCWVHIYLRSEGCNDTGIVGCGHALIQVNGKDYSLHKRGHNIVVIDRYGKVIKRASFDTYGVASSGSQMAKFINSIRYGHIVLIAVQDSGEKYIAKAKAALATLGATEPYTLGFRSSWAFIGMKGNKNFEFKRQAAKPRYEGPTRIHVKMNTQPLYVGPVLPVLPKKGKL